MKQLPVNNEIFDKIDTPAKAYWLGVLYTDGNVSRDGKYVSLETGDLEWVQKYKRFLCSEHKIQNIYREKLTASYTYKLTVGSRHMNQILRTYGVVPNKSHDHNTPVYIPINELEKDFWRGCIDGDGCLAYWPNNDIATMTLTNKNVTLLNSCKAFFGGGGATQKYRKKNYYFIWTAGTKKAVKLAPMLGKIYKNCQFEERLERKYNKYLEICDIAINKVNTTLQELEYTKKMLYNECR